MTHLDLLIKNESQYDINAIDLLLTKSTGKFYTPNLIATNIIKDLSDKILELKLLDGEKLKIVEPFAGDGRLLVLLISELYSRNQSAVQKINFELSIWDFDKHGLEEAKDRLKELAAKLNLNVNIFVRQGDTFKFATDCFDSYDICITNPPWENLRPSSKDLSILSKSDSEEFSKSIKSYASYITDTYQHAAPSGGFSSYSVNLSRSGAEVALSLIKDCGLCGIILPATILADQASTKIRKWMFENFALFDIGYYSAEGRYFDGVDQQSITLILQRLKPYNQRIRTRIYSCDNKCDVADFEGDLLNQISDNSYILPIHFGLDSIRMQDKLAHLPKFSTMEERADGLWAGREIDETNYKSYLRSTGNYKFVKGRMIDRFHVVEQPEEFVGSNGPKIPKSANYHRIAWRDVSRPTQKRRVKATIIPPGWVAGNSLNVAYFKDGDIVRLKALLGIMNSIVFETQLRSILATSHISLGAVRKARVIDVFDDLSIVNEISTMVDNIDSEHMPLKLEITIAKLYGISRDEFILMLRKFNKITDDEIQYFEKSSYWNLK